MLKRFMMVGAAALVVGACGGTESSSTPDPYAPGNGYCRTSPTPNSSKVVIAKCDARSDGLNDEVVSGGCDPGAMAAGGEPGADVVLVGSDMYTSAGLGDASGWMCAWASKAAGSDGAFFVVATATATVCCRKAQ